MPIVQHLSKKFGGEAGKKINAIDNISLDIPQGQLFTLLGPSGCGKTTTLRCIAGLERPDEGKIIIDGRVVFDSEGVFVPPEQRDIGMVFQSYAIWPHMNVFDNVAYPLRVFRRERYSRAVIKERVRQALETVHMEKFEQRPATQLSGGQQQRVALARALVRKPNLILLDEPLSNLDAKLREAMRLELKRLHSELDVTMIYVTHDQAEALALSDQIAVMNSGRIVQMGDPETIYQKPNSSFVAEFIGSANFLPGYAETPGVAGSLQNVRTKDAELVCVLSRDVADSQEVLIFIRPENVQLRSLLRTEEGSKVLGEAWLNVFKSRIVNRVYLGEIVEYLALVDNREFRVRVHPDFDFHIGEEVELQVKVEHCMAIPLEGEDIKRQEVAVSNQEVI